MIRRWCLTLLIFGHVLVSYAANNPLIEFVQCRLCETVRLEGPVSDCSCDFGTVNKAVSSFFAPVLFNLTQSTFFRFFRVDLRRPCPFWNVEGKCVMEGCSVCTCDREEIPPSWLEGGGNNKLSGEAENDWTDMPENSELCQVTSSDSDSQTWFMDPFDSGSNGIGNGNGNHGDNHNGEGGVFVNLLQNPERFTGYSGPSATRVWRAMQQENCFGGQNDTCVEKRVFYRVMSGLQSSISTHVAREYRFPDGRWAANLPWFIRAVGAHPDRVSNLYFTFLFVLRAVVKSGEVLTRYPYDTGNKREDEEVRRLIETLVKAKLPELPNAAYSSADTYGHAFEGLPQFSLSGKSSSSGSGSGSGGSGSGSSDKSQSAEDKQCSTGMAEDGLEEPDCSIQPTDQAADNQTAFSSSALKVVSELDQCRNGFDESVLFQVPLTSEVDKSRYWRDVQEKNELKEDFRLKFRNISRIMDCVTCEKCRVWGKLQILGVGTAIKILLTPESELAMRPDILNRQEIIALINLLHQLSKSIVFASHAAEMELTDKMTDFVKNYASVGSIALVGLIVFIAALRYAMTRRGKSSGADKKQR